MDHRVPKVGAAISILLAVAALITFIFLNQKFEGPDPVGGLISSPYELTARFENSKTLPSKQPVLHKGVSVGRVRSVSWDPRAQEAEVTFTIDEQIAPLYRDAVLQIGERSLLGDPYLNLIDRGNEQAGELATGDEVRDTRRPINFDEALDFLDEEGRGRVRSLIDTVAEGAAPAGNGERLNATIGGLAGTLSELRLLTDTLRGQEEQIATLVSDAGTVLSVLGNRTDSVRTIVGSGRRALDGLGANTESLGLAVEELPKLLDSGRSTLAGLRPLLNEAAPLVADLRAIAPDLAPALEEGAPFSIGPISRDLIAVIEGLEDQRLAAEEILPGVVKVNEAAGPVVRKAGPAARNTVPVADYLEPRANSIAAFYALGASVTANGDEVGRYARFALGTDPALTTGPALPGAYDPNGTCSPSWRYCFNAYPEPNDTLDHQPFSGSYPQLRAFNPPSRQSVLNR